jgi:hypothetical protein
MEMNKNYAPAHVLADDKVITLVKPNPKRGKSRERYEYYKIGMTVREYRAKCKANGQEKYANPDLKWDLQHGLIAISNLF